MFTWGNPLLLFHLQLWAELLGSFHTSRENPLGFKLGSKIAPGGSGWVESAMSSAHAFQIPAHVPRLSSDTGNSSQWQIVIYKAICEIVICEIQ